LVLWSEARARQQLGAAEVNLPARIRIFVDEHRADVRALVERCGYVPMRWYSELRRELSRPLPEASLAAGVRLEPYSQDRAEEVRVTHNEAFVRDHWGSQQVDPEQWQLDVTGDESFMPTWSFVAIDTDTDRVVGYLISGAHEQDWAAQGFTEGWTSLVAVRREWRNRRVAAALLITAMQAYREGDMQYAGLGVDSANSTGALGLYERLGYERRRGIVMFAKEF
ncbi:MAG: GNAT family N-acetyltransferase, partial [Jiangellaceae bacterium]